MTETPGILQLLAFAAEPGGGNPAGVVLDATALDDARMQRIAADLGHPRDGLRGSPRRPSRGGALLLARGRGPLLRARHHRHGGRARRGGGHRPLHVRHRGRRRRGLDRPRRRGARPCRVHQCRAVHDRPRTRRRRPTPRHPGSSPRRSRRADAARPDLRRQPAPGVAIASREVFDAFTFDPARLRALMDERGWKGTVITVHVAGDLADGLVARGPQPLPGRRHHRRPRHRIRSAAVRSAPTCANVSVYPRRSPSPCGRVATSAAERARGRGSGIRWHPGLRNGCAPGGLSLARRACPTVDVEPGRTGHVWDMHQPWVGRGCGPPLTLVSCRSAPRSPPAPSACAACAPPAPALRPRA